MGLFSFTKADRLLKRAEFLHLSQIGQTAHNSHFVAVFAPGNRNRIRLGITVSKKVGKSVTRTRIKRLIREYFRHNRHGIAGNWDINIIAKRRAADLSSAEAFLSLKHIFDKLSRVGYQTNISAVD
jgi:ribonuclease P protein component